MAELKTKSSKASVTAFINAIDDRDKRADAKKVAAMMRKATRSRARMWGPSIVGYGKYFYTNAAGKHCEFMLSGFSPRKQALTVYIMPGFSKFAGLMKRLGRHSTGKSCLYIKRLADVDEATLQKLITESVKQMRRKYETG